jgi:hypothetical protein
MRNEEVKEEPLNIEEESAASSYMTPRVGNATIKIFNETMKNKTIGRNDSTVNYDNSLLS